MGVPEIGSVSIAELESVKGKLGLPVERDFHFAPRHTISVYARAARTEGTITCAMGGGQPAGSCAFGVKRKGNGSGTVIVTKPDGRKRTIFFENGNATGADTSEADPGEFAARKQNDLSIGLVGEERYEVPDAVIFGG